MHTNNLMETIDKRLTFLETLLRSLKLNVEYIEKQKQRKQSATRDVPEKLKKVWKERELKAKRPI